VQARCQKWIFVQVYRGPASRPPLTSPGRGIGIEAGVEDRNLRPVVAKSPSTRHDSVLTPFSTETVIDEDPTLPSRNTHDISGSADRYETLVELLEHQTKQAAADRERELAMEELRLVRDRTSTPYWLAGILLLVTAWLWLFPPAILRTDPPPPQPIEREESALRFAIYLQAQRLKAFHMEEGEYPTELEAAGPPLPGVQYLRLAPQLYQLTAATERLLLTYRSDLPLSEFVASGAEVLDVVEPEPEAQP